MVLVQKWPFFLLFCLGNIGQENVFYDILEQKNAFLGYKKTRSKRRKIVIFLKGLTHSFCPKNILGNVGLENVFYVIVERNNAVLCYKNKKFNKSKN